jgi:hypothetical protein
VYIHTRRRRLVKLTAHVGMDSGSFIEAGKLGKMFSPHFVILIET